jgi:O-antigen/teichoic acid export membrane protein
MSTSPPSRPPVADSGSAGLERWAQALVAAVPRAALGNLLAKLAIVALGLAITVMVARMGPKVQGAFALFVAVESALLTLFSGLGLWLARQVSRQVSGQAWPALPMLLGVLRSAVLLGGLAALVLLAVSWQARTLPYSQLWLLALGAPFLLLVPTATGLWLGEGRMWPINLAQVAAPALVLAGLLGAGWLTTDYAGRAPVVVMVLIAWVSGKAAVALLTALAALRHASQRDEALPAGALSSPGWRSEWRFVATIGVTNVISLLNYRASLFLVERFHGLEAVGTYSVAVTVAELLWLLSSSVTVSLYARIGHPERAFAAATTVRAVRVNVLATLAAAPVLLVGAWWAVPWVLGEAYRASLWPLFTLLPGVAAYAAASSLSAFYTNHLGRPHLSGLIAALSLLLSVGLGLWWVPTWGAVGAAAASSLGYIGAIGVAYAVFLRHAGLPWRAMWARDPLS